MTDDDDPVVRSMSRHPAGKQRATVEIEMDDVRAIATITTIIEKAVEEIDLLDYDVEQMNFRVVNKNGYVVATVIWTHGAWRADLSNYGEVET